MGAPTHPGPVEPGEEPLGRTDQVDDSGQEGEGGWPVVSPRRQPPQHQALGALCQLPQPLRQRPQAGARQPRVLGGGRQGTWAPGDRRVVGVSGVPPRPRLHPTQGTPESHPLPRPGCPHIPPPYPAQGTPMSPPSPSPRCPHTPPLQPRVPPCPPPPPSPGSLHVIVSVHPHLHLAQGAPTPPLPPFHHGTPPAAPTGADTHQGSELLHRLQQQLLVPQAPHSQCLQCPRRQPQQVEPRQPPGLEGVPLYGRIQPCPQPCPSTSRTPREGGGRPSTPPPVSLLADPSLLGGTRPRDEFARSQPRWRVWPDVHPAIGRIQGQTPPFCPPTRDKG